MLQPCPAIDRSGTRLQRSPRLCLLDSGSGGLTVFSALAEALPEADLLHCADFAWFPYGGRAPEQIIARVRALALDLVARHDPDLLVIACNTASTLALPTIRASLSLPVIGIVPAVKPAAALTRSGTIGVIATARTIESAALAGLIETHAQGCRVLTAATPLLVTLAEQHLAGHPPEPAALMEAMAPLTAQPGAESLDVLVLGCTHFPLLQGLLAPLLPPGTLLLDPAEAIARRARSLLGLEHARAGQVSPGRREMLATAAPLSPLPPERLQALFGIADLRLDAFLGGGQA